MARGDMIPDRLEAMPSGFVLPADDAGSFEYLCAVELAIWIPLAELGLRRGWRRPASS